ncbi:Pyridoxine 4-dehydrogenase [Aspergillus tanneri]|uniref:Pyridoxine 4-dehydrogenase n=1 Tax=Aspergillus tanneri TaxID=1220188 RepID=A0A5M9M4V8_9EURO|nr:Pyridoxine 4-dehydrogenase [Aspergillus tanneri]KAA8642045.1 Pyridoxine 4-dehydrogenase [Aspergillus tanneri]
MDSNVPVEETLEALKELVNGQIVAVGLSEIGAAAIKRAHAVCPLSVVEAEFSLWTTSGVSATCRIWELYFELCAAGTNMFSRFQPEIFPKILELVDKVNEFAIRRGVTQVQLMLGWIRAHSDTGDYIAIIPTPVWLLTR